MNAQTLGRMGLSLRLSLARLGWGNALAVLLLAAGAAAWLWGMPRIEQQEAASRRALIAVQTSLATVPAQAPAPAVPPTEQHLQQFRDVLGESRYAEQQVKTLFAIAAKNGLNLGQAEYKFGASKDGQFHTYAVSLPLKGSYAAVRAFCEQVLLAIPFASLDEVVFKRESVGNAGLDAKLRFTLYLDNAGGVTANEDKEP